MARTNLSDYLIEGQLTVGNTLNSGTTVTLLGPSTGQDIDLNFDFGAAGSSYRVSLGAYYATGDVDEGSFIIESDHDFPIALKVSLSGTTQSYYQQNPDGKFYFSVPKSAGTPDLFLQGYTPGLSGNGIAKVTLNIDEWGGGSPNIATYTLQHLFTWVSGVSDVSYSITGADSYHSFNVDGVTELRIQKDILNVGTTVGPASPLVQHIVLPDASLVTAAGDLQLVSNLYYETGPTWKAITTDVSAILQIRDGSHYFWTGTSASAGSSPSLTERFRIAPGGIGIGTSTLPSNPSNTHCMIAGSGIFGSVDSTIRVAANLNYDNSTWKYVAAGGQLATVYQQTAGNHQFWTAPANNDSSGSTATLTNVFYISASAATSAVPLVVGGGAIQVTGSNTPGNGGGTEIHYLSGEGYFQSLDRNGTVWKPVNVNGSVINLSFGTDGSSTTVKGGVDTNGLFGVAMQKAGDPNTTDIPNGYWRVVENTSGATIKLWYNDNGTLKSVALT